MSNREIVQQGLDARKNVRAAEARAEKLREQLAVANEACFYEQLRLQNARRAWQYEREDLTGTISRQRVALRQMREQLAAAEDRAREARQLRSLINAAKAVSSLFILIGIRDIGWIVPWLVDSLTALSVTCLCIAIFNWLRNNKTPTNTTQ